MTLSLNPTSTTGATKGTCSRPSSTSLLAIWMRLDRAGAGGFDWLFPEAEMEDWLTERFGIAALQPDESSLLASFLE